MIKLRLKYATASFMLLLLLLVANLQSASLPLSPEALASRGGSRFWKDPCTWDGFLVGAGVVLCGSGSPGGCVSAIIGILKAVKVDDCFK